MWRLVRAGVLLIVVYTLLAYLVLPALWRHYEHHPALETAPKTADTSDGIPGDPLNVAVVGTEHEIIKAFLDARWYPADPITLKTSLEIAERVLLGRPYPRAPVSNLFVFGRRQDLAFEKPAAASPRRRAHVRLWRSNDHGVDGRPLWIGGATFDESVGVSHYTGQVTHHIAPDVDVERDQLMADLAAAGQLERRYRVTGVGLTLNGRNGGGDRYFTDGEMAVGVISLSNVRHAAPTELANPPAVDIKNQVWSWFRPLLSSPSADDPPPAEPGKKSD